MQVFSIATVAGKVRGMASKGKKEKKRIGDDSAHTSEELDNGTKRSEYFLRGSSE